ncbi:MAG: NAD(P)-dependent oxidoreductase [SAR324 cluster bacterium]|nr:NAD(P)-dependent oxidoreductase [SAR324 cluster bacterium]
MINVLVNKTEHERDRVLIEAAVADAFPLHWVDFDDPESVSQSVLAEADAIVGRVNLTEAQYALAPKLKLVQTLKAGYEMIDVDRAKSHGVAVSNNGGANAISVAEHVLLLLLALYRQLLFHHHSVSQGPWENRKLQNRELYGKTLGIIGLGHIGQALAERAQALGMSIRYFDVVRKESLEQERGYRFQALPDVFAESDIVSVHVPLTDYTRNLINRRTLKMMRSDALLINAARGGIQDEDALHAALTGGWISGAGLDVFQTEPLPLSSPLCALSNVVLTPHSAPAIETYPRAVQHAVGNLQRLDEGGPLVNLVTDHEANTRAFLQHHPDADLGLPAPRA